MKRKKYFYWVFFWAGLSSSIFFKIFWKHLYPKLGVTWNEYVVEGCFFLLAMFIAFHYKSKQQKQQEDDVAADEVQAHDDNAGHSEV